MGEDTLLTRGYPGGYKRILQMIFKNGGPHSTVAGYRVAMTKQRRLCSPLFLEYQLLIQQV